jgi:hypothetical protein
MSKTPAALGAAELNCSAGKRYQEPGMNSIAPLFYLLLTFLTFLDIFSGPLYAASLNFKLKCQLADFFFNNLADF